uniref:Tyr recombinase domain-containing protein n=1 Tax=Eubacterium plexicaudatum ASF492 TaxID=1235802 RepID=N2AA28_9FIRM
MEAIALNNVTYTEEPHKTERKTCEYCGDDYPILTNMKGKYFIEVDGERKYLDKNGKVINKQRGTKSIKTAIENFEDMKKIQNYFIEHNQWNFYLLFTLNANTGRRISDLRQALWSDFFYKNGSMKKFWNIKKLDEDDQRIPGEQKTGKSKELFVNIAVQEAFRIFLENEKSINFKYDYDEPIFKQLHGTHRGKVISEEGYRKALIKAGECLDYEIRSHSMRRGMGKMLLELHPNDPVAKSVLMELYNHSSEKMTNKYLGETAKLEMEYLDDYGQKYKKYVMDGEEVPFLVKNPVSVYDNSELRNYMLCAFGKILDLKDETDATILIKLYNELLDGLETISR